MEIKKEDFWKEILDIHPNLIEHNADNLRRLSKVISSVVIQMLPDRLYQYRSFYTENDTYESCSHNVTNLINDEMWGTKKQKKTINMKSSRTLERMK